jgi:hypothetical protein
MGGLGLEEALPAGGTAPTPIIAAGQARPLRRGPLALPRLARSTLLLLRDDTGREAPLASSSGRLLVGPHSVLVEVPPRLLLPVALAIAADAQPEEEVDQ